MPAYVIYARKSTESEDRQIASIDSQIQELKLLAARRGITVAETLTESYSAKAPGRPIFGNLMKRISRGEIRGVLCWKLDRLARNALDAGFIIHSLQEGKIERIITSEGDKTSDSNDLLMQFVEFGVATKYIGDLRTNVTRGNRDRFRHGWPNYRPPQGYLEDHATKTVVNDPKRFPLVRKMWDLLLGRRMRPSQIIKEANEQWGYRTRRTPHGGDKPLSIAALYEIFHNRYYMGLMCLKNGETWRGAHQPMVTPEEFDQAQELLGRSGRSRPIRHEFAYSGLLRCGCGGLLTAEQHVKASGFRYVYYRCHARRGANLCREPSLPESRLNEQLVAELSRYRVAPRAAAWIRSKIEKGLRNDLEHFTVAHQALQEAVQQAEREGEALLTLKLRDQVDDATYDRRRLEILERQATLKIRLELPAARPEELMAKLDEALDLPAQALKSLRNRDVVGQRLLVQKFASNWRIEDRKALYTANNPFVSFEKTRDSSLWWTVVEEVRTWLRSTAGHMLLPDRGLDSGHAVMMPRTKRSP